MEKIDEELIVLLLLIYYQPYSTDQMLNVWSLFHYILGYLNANLFVQYVPVNR